MFLLLKALIKLSSSFTLLGEFSFTVLFEDSTALLGILIALLASMLTYSYGFRYLDGVASVSIGGLLMGVAFLLGAKTKALLVGEGYDKQTLCLIREIAEGVAGVERLGYPLTTFFGPHVAFLTMTVQFKRGLSSSQVEAAVGRMESLIQISYPELKHIFLEVDTVDESDPEGEGQPPKKESAASFASLS